MRSLDHFAHAVRDLGQAGAAFEARLTHVAGVRIAGGSDFDESTGALKAGSKVRLLAEAEARALRTVKTTSAQRQRDEAALAAAGVQPLAMRLVAEIDSARGFPHKIEGLAVLDASTLAIANDNDFGLGGFTVSAGGCQVRDSGAASQLIVIHLAQPLR